MDLLSLVDSAGWLLLLVFLLINFFYVFYFWRLPVCVACVADADAATVSTFSRCVHACLSVCLFASRLGCLRAAASWACLPANCTSLPFTSFHTPVVHLIPHHRRSHHSPPQSIIQYLHLICSTSSPNRLRRPLSARQFIVSSGQQNSFNIDLDRPHLPRRTHRLGKATRTISHRYPRPDNTARPSAYTSFWRRRVVLQNLLFRTNISAS